MYMEHQLASGMVDVQMAEPLVGSGPPAPRRLRPQPSLVAPQLRQPPSRTRALASLAPQLRMPVSGGKIADYIGEFRGTLLHCPNIMQSPTSSTGSTQACTPHCMRC